MKILGIDPGSLITGYGIVYREKGGRLRHVCDGHVRLDAKAPISERLLAIQEALTGVIEEFKPDDAAVESIFFAKNVRSAIMLGHARGAALLSAASCGLRVFEYAPKSVKVAVTGYGSATKGQVQKMVQALLKTPGTASPDAADALATAICHIHSHREHNGRLNREMTPRARGC